MIGPYRLSAFPKTKQGGNKAGVVLDAECLNDADMQRIAAEVGYSETAFVTTSAKADVKVRFFTPRQEVDLCGHATIATFNLMRDLKRLAPGRYTQETNAGILAIDIREDTVFMQQNRPVFGAVLNGQDVAACFRETDVIDHALPIQLVSTGLYEIFVPIRDVDTLHRLTPDLDAIGRLTKAHGAIGVHAFALDTEVAAYGRNFAPLVGIDEESATGTSNGALACYLHQYQPPQTQYVLRQGYSMNQPSEIIVNLSIEANQITAVWVGGSAIRIDTKEDNT